MIRQIIVLFQIIHQISGCLRSAVGIYMISGISGIVTPVNAYLIGQ